MKLTLWPVVNSFDDGWCIVGRDSVFKSGEVELGAIPAWCFMKPVQGLRAERPMRTSSLGVTVTGSMGNMLIVGAYVTERANPRPGDTKRYSLIVLNR